MVAAACYAATAVSFRGEPRPWERMVFTRINDGPDWRWLRLPQQLGTPWALPALALVSLVTGRRRDAVVALVALPVVKGVEVRTKKLVRRPRPLYTTPTELRDDAPVEGPSYPSGHTAIATCVTALASRTAPRPVGVLMSGALVISAFTRVHQGAHHPSDTLGGFFLGYAVAGILDDVFPAT